MEIPDLKNAIETSIIISDLIENVGLAFKKLLQVEDAEITIKKYNVDIKPKINDFKKDNNNKSPNVILTDFLRNFIVSNNLSKEYEAAGFSFYGRKINPYLWACITKIDSTITDRKHSHYPQLFILVNKFGVKFGFDYGDLVKNDDEKVQIIRKNKATQEKIVEILKSDINLKIYSKSLPEKSPSPTDELKINNVHSNSSLPR